MRKLILLVLMFMGCTYRLHPQTPASPTSTTTSITQIAPTSVATVPAESIFIQIRLYCCHQETPGPTAESIYPPVTTTEWVKGPASAKVTIIEYSDFQ
jgi:hypothetical protein